VRLLLTVARVEGALVRVLGVVVRRGYEPLELSAVAKDSGVVDVDLRVHGAEPAERLSSHLAKLIDVRTVKVVLGAGHERDHGSRHALAPSSACERRSVDQQGDTEIRMRHRHNTSPGAVCLYKHR
jgi:acetolactate synthase regulatory subunit